MFACSYLSRKETYDVYTPCRFEGAESTHEFLDENTATDGDKNWTPQATLNSTGNVPKPIIIGYTSHGHCWEGKHAVPYAIDMGTGTVLDKADWAPECPAKANNPVQGIGPGSLTRKITTECSGGNTLAILEAGKGIIPIPASLSELISKIEVEKKEEDNQEMIVEIYLIEQRGKNVVFGDLLKNEEAGVSFIFFLKITSTVEDIESNPTSTNVTPG